MGSAASKPNLIRNSDALLRLNVLGEIIHGESLAIIGVYYSPNSISKVLFKPCVPNIAQYNHPQHDDDLLTFNRIEPSTETLSILIKRGLAKAEVEAKSRGENAGRSSAAISDLVRMWYELVEFHKQYEPLHEKTDRYTRRNQSSRPSQGFVH